MTIQAVAAREPVPKQLGSELIAFRKGNQAFSKIANSGYSEVIPQMTRGTAVIGYGHDRGDLNSRFQFWPFGFGNVLYAAKEDRKPGSTSNSDEFHHEGLLAAAAKEHDS